MSTHGPTPPLIKTSTPGIYRRGGRYVVIWRHRGKQYKSFHRTLAEAREAKGEHTRTNRQAPQSRRPFDEYAREWVAKAAQSAGSMTTRASRTPPPWKLTRFLTSARCPCATSSVRTSRG